MREVFRRKRVELGLTHQQVAELAGIDRTTYTKIENGDRQNPRVDTVFKITRALDIEFFLPGGVTNHNRKGAVKK